MSAAGRTDGWRDSQTESSRFETSRPEKHVDNYREGQLERVGHLADAGHVVVVVTLGEVGLHAPLQLRHVLTGATAARNLIMFGC